ncbi:hypothetical protein WKH15_01090 [Pantoea agglomerans]
MAETAETAVRVKTAEMEVTAVMAAAMVVTAVMAAAMVVMAAAYNS